MENNCHCLVNNLRQPHFTSVNIVIINLHTGNSQFQKVSVFLSKILKLLPNIQNLEKLLKK